MTHIHRLSEACFTAFPASTTELISGLAASTITSVPSFVVSIVTYVFTAIALYSIAKRRGLKHAWLSWIPVANVWVLGSISDQYRYVTRGEIKSKRKTLLILNIISAILGVVVVILCIVMMADLIGGAIVGRNMDRILKDVLAYVAGMMGLLLPILGVSIAHAIIYYMALFDVFTSCDPENRTVFFVVGLLIGITRPVFLFICRNKDLGMPPRRDIPPQTGNYV